MASNLRVDNIQPSTGMGIGIGTANGSVTITGDLSVDTSKGLTVGTGATISGGTNYITASTNGSERVRIDADGNFNLVNTAGIMTAFKYETPALINNHFKSQSTTAGAYVRMYASAGTGQWDIYGNGANLRFSDNASTGNIQMDRPLVMNSQNIVMSSGNGIDFSATADSSGTMSSELLDDYEEGTYTPVLSGGGYTYTSGSYTAGRYTKVGRIVTVEAHFNISAISGSSDGSSTRITLPFAPSQLYTAGRWCQVLCRLAYFNASAIQRVYCAQLTTNSSSADIVYYYTCSGSGTDQPVNIGADYQSASNNGQIAFTMTYVT